MAGIFLRQTCRFDVLIYILPKFRKFLQLSIFQTKNVTQEPHPHSREQDEPKITLMGGERKFRLLFISIPLPPPTPRKNDKSMLFFE